MEEKQISKAHKLVVNNRKTSMVTGVLDVLSFDLNEILLETEQGMMMVKGSDMHVNRLNLEKGKWICRGILTVLLIQMRISRENKARTFSQNCSGDPMFGIEAEGLVFVQALVTGMIVYDAYVCIRKFRRIIRHNLFAIAVEDVLFWLGMSLF